ncbi:MAG: efflux RND transporter periplasmic adaptor subunit [Luteolibacter sp.]
MSSEDLTGIIRKIPESDRAPERRRSYAWLLPVGLLFGFVLILGLLFGKRLIPAKAVTTAPVVTIRTNEPDPSEPDSGKGGEDVSALGKGSLLFQASGWVEPDPYVTLVPSLVNGVVESVHALEGQVVKKGDLLAKLIDEDAKLDLRSAEQEYVSLEKKITAHCVSLEIVNAEITAAERREEALKAQLDDAKDNYTRLEGLSEGAVSRQEVVQARLAADRQAAMHAEAQAEPPRLRARIGQIEAEAESMRASLDELATRRDRAALALERTRITAPVDGIVLHLHVAPGKKRMLNMDDPKSAVIVELYDPQSLQARIDVPLNEAANLTPGQAVELVSEILPDRTFAGRVTRISGQADLQRNTLQAKVAIEDPDPVLRPDMLVRAKFFSVSGRNTKSGNSSVGASVASNRLAIYVPENALVDDSSVWVVSPNGEAELRKITLGRDTKDGHRRVTDGLLSGESVILPPHDDLEEGARLSVSETN